jgi:hypothetical protein
MEKKTGENYDRTKKRWKDRGETNENRKKTERKPTKDWE